jgi:hypothetical protein
MYYVTASYQIQFFSFSLSLVIRFRVRQLLASNTDNRAMILGFLENSKWQINMDIV